MKNIETMKNFFSQKKFWVIGIAAATLLLLLIMKSCGSETPSEKAFTIGEDAQWRTINVMGKQREFAAFTKNLLTALGKEQQIQFKVAFIPHLDLIDSLEDGDVVGILTDLEPNSFNQQHMLFSQPFFLIGPVLIVPSSWPQNGWNEKGHKIIGIESDQANSLALEHDPSTEIRLYRDILKALSDLNTGAIDAAVFSVIPASFYIQTFYSKELKIVTAPLNDDGLRLVTLKKPKGEELIEAFNKGLEQLKENGTYDALIEKWSLVNPEKFGQ